MLFRTITSGVYVVGVAHGRRRSAFTAAWVAQVSFNPLLLSLSVNPDNASYRLMKMGRAFSVNVLPSERMDLARHFGSPSERDKLADDRWRPGQTGAPILDEAVSYFECQLEFTRRAGDHVLTVGRVIGGEVLQPGATPMTYAQTGDLDGSSALYPRRF
jgi:flavin reductase (DIM6/NTAB) family NADH-FMN oxidoreductase RutF